MEFDLPAATAAPTGEGWEGCLGTWSVGDMSVSAWITDDEQFVMHGPDGHEDSVANARAYAWALLAACETVESFSSVVSVAGTSLTGEAGTNP